MSDSSRPTNSGIQPNLGGLLCYLIWWVTVIIFLFMGKDSWFIRFHTVQSVIAFRANILIQIVTSFIPFIGWILSWIIWVLAIILWIACMVKAHQGQMLKLPIAGDITMRQSQTIRP